MSSLFIRRLAMACAASLVASGAAAAAERTELTIYRSDDGALFGAGEGGSVNAGYAVAREPRQLDLKNGTQDITLGGLPAWLDTEAMSLDIKGGGRVLSQRLRLGQGADAAVSGLIGQPIDVLGSTGQVLASGTLLRAGDGLLVSDATGATSLVRQYAAVRAHGNFNIGSSLDLRIDASRSGATQAVLSYPTAGLGWRAAYVGTLQGDRCRMQFESRASIANRSGRDWNDIQLTLVAGQPRFSKSSAPRPMMMANARAAKAESYDMPQQESLGDYRSYTLPGLVSLPDGSITQSPLYDTRAIDCQRIALYETGSAWTPPQPNTTRDIGGGGNEVTSSISFAAFDTLPAGYVRVLEADKRGTPQFVGESRIDDTPKNANVNVVLGNVVDLRVEREQSDFKVDLAQHRLEEAFKLTFTNAGDSERTVTVREHPQRWREWTLMSSSIKPAMQKTDTLEFQVKVPAHGKVTLDYRLRYQWTAEQNVR